MKNLLLAILFSCIVCVVHAQNGSYNNPPADLGYPPPAGWTYLCGLDSAVVKYIDAHNDSISISVEDFSKPEGKRNYYFRSYNGGVDWDTVRKEISEDYYIPPVNRNNVNMVKSIKWGTEEITVYVNVKDSTGGCVHSYAYGKYRYFYPFEKDFIVSIIRTISQTQSYSFYFWDIIQNPINADDVMFSLVGGFGDLGAYYRTTNGGQTWGFTKLPPFQFPIENWETNFNRTNKHRRIMYLSGWFKTQSDQAYFETTDDGETWTRIVNPYGYIKYRSGYDNVPEALLAGIRNEIEFRAFNTIKRQFKDFIYPVYNYYAIQSIFLDQKGEQDWLHRIYGDKLLTYNKGYRLAHIVNEGAMYDINVYNGGFKSALLKVEAWEKDSSDTKHERNSYAETNFYYTDNDGETWTNVLHVEFKDSKFFILSEPYGIDKGTNCIINDILKSNESHISFRHHFWKNNIITSVPEQTDTSSTLSIQELFPSPANDFITLNFKTTQVGQVTITLYDIHGRKTSTILTQTMYAGKQQVIWEGCKTLTNGAYMLEITTGLTRITKPVIIIH